MTLKYMKKIKGATDKNSAKNDTCKQGFNESSTYLSVCWPSPMSSSCCWFWRWWCWFSPLCWRRRCWRRRSGRTVVVPRAPGHCTARTPRAPPPGRLGTPCSWPRTLVPYSCSVNYQYCSCGCRLDWNDAVYEGWFLLSQHVRSGTETEKES